MAEKCLRQNILKSKEGKRFQSTQPVSDAQGQLLENLSMQDDYITPEIQDDPTARSIDR
jgi:hypothetical protein